MYVGTKKTDSSTLAAQTPAWWHITFCCHLNNKCMCNCWVPHYINICAQLSGTWSRLWAAEECAHVHSWQTTWQSNGTVLQHASLFPLPLVQLTLSLSGDQDTEILSAVKKTTANSRRLLSDLQHLKTRVYGMEKQVLHVHS